MTTEVKTEFPDYRKKLKCSFEQLDDVFDDCIKDALHNMTNQDRKSVV